MHTSKSRYTYLKVFLSALLVAAVSITLADAAGTQTFSTPGTFSFNVPAYGTITVKVWGAGGAGGSYGGSNSVSGSGGASSFNATVIGNGGGGGSFNYTTNNAAAVGAGGTASGGDTNTSGSAGGTVVAAPSGNTGWCGGNGGNSPSGGLGGTTNCVSGATTSPTLPGGGGFAGGFCLKGACSGATGGGGAGYSTKVYSTGQLTVGSNVSVVVGAPGVSFDGGNGEYFNGSKGAAGTVQVTWTDPGPPGVPGTPTFSSVTYAGMRVSWTAGTNAITYKVERCSGAGCSTFTQIAAGVATLFYDDSGLSPTTSYTYRVRATNGSGDGSYSATATQVTPAGSAPSCTLTPSSQTISIGNPAALSYTISGTASSATINGVSVPTTSSGSYNPSPSATTNYTMTVTNAFGSNNCGPATVTVVNLVTVFLTSGTTWTVPADWNSSNNTIEVIGGGGGSRAGGGGGGGGGAYSRVSNITLTPGASISYTVGAAGVGGASTATAGSDTWFNAASMAACVTAGPTVCVGAKGGASTITATGAAGGVAGSGVGTVKNSGGTGGNGSTGSPAGGGGGAGGPSGAGANGGNAQASGAGGGGGGSTGGTVGAIGASGIGGTGGNNSSGTGGGIHAANGTVGGGGGGGNTSEKGGNGGAGTDWDSTHGAGGGGGGSGNSGTGAGIGGLYGGGAGAAGLTIGANGGQGIIVIKYAPIPLAPTCTLTPASQTIPGGGTAALNYTIAFSATSATINGVSVPATPSGTYTPSPFGTTNYTMTVTNANGSNTCGPVTVTVGTIQTIFLTSGTSWAVPSNWNSLNNTIEVIGGGGGGGGAANNQGGGGGGGGYSKITNLSLTYGGSVAYGVGLGGAGGGALGGDGGDTYFCNSSANCASIAGTSVVVGATGGDGGARGNPGAGGLGGTAATGVGSVKYSGGNGSASLPSNYGGGGAGAAGPNGGGASATNGSGAAGGSGSGGAGGAAGNPPGAGGNGTEFDSTHGSGGGGGGVNASVITTGGAGGNYGGGGGGARYAGTSIGGSGAQGVIVITYTVSPGPTCTITPASQMIGSGGAATLNYTITGGATSATINGVAVSTAVSGTYYPSPTVTTNYTMTVTNALGSNNCGPVTVTIGTPASQVIFLTSGTSWTVPSDWNSSSNSVEAIGGGGGPGNAWNDVGAGAGGGGAYSKSTNVTLTPSASVAYVVGTGGTTPAGSTGTNGGPGGDSYFNGGSCGAASVCAKGGIGGIGTNGTRVGGAGGDAASGVGSTKFSGGKGGDGGGAVNGGGGGGGGAAGPNGAGGAGGVGHASGGGGGAGGSNSGSAGGAAPSTVGAAGGTNRLGSGAGAANGGAGSGGGGGGGGNNASTAGGAGSMEVIWTQTSNSATAGPGAGGGGGARLRNGGAPALYGGGGGANGDSDAANVGMPGANGIIVITYTPAFAVPGAPGTPTFSNVNGTSMRISWTAASGAMIYKVERCSGVGCSSFSEIATGLTGLFYDDSGLTAGTSYSYRIRASATGGNGAYSGTGSQIAMVPISAPGAPTFSNVTTSAMRVSWAAATGATTYKVERCAGAGCSSFAQIASGLATLFYDDSGLAGNTSYTYRIRGTNVGGDGPYSITWSQVTTQSGSFVPITGWAWSEAYVDANRNGVDDVGEPRGGIGWISMNCLTGSSSGTSICNTYSYGLQISTTDGSVSGYAWSDNYGWISANSSDLTGCPVAPCTATVANGKLNGWLKVISANDSQNGGWDGFIALSDTNTGDAFNYGVTFASGAFGGYAWGSTIVGWTSFTGVVSQYLACTPSTVYTCSDTQTIVRTDTNNSCQPTVTNTSCTMPQFCSVGVSSCVWPPPTGVSGAGGLTGHLTARPNLISKNATTTVYWAINNVTACTVRNNANGTVWSGGYSATSTCSLRNGTGCTSSPITQQTVYTLSCTALDGGTFQETATVNLLPDFQER